MNCVMFFCLSLLGFFTATINGSDAYGFLKPYEGLCAATEELRTKGHLLFEPSVPEKSITSAEQTIRQRNSLIGNIDHDKRSQIVNTVCKSIEWTHACTIGQLALCAEHKDLCALKKTQGAFYTHLLWGGSSLLLFALHRALSESSKTAHSQLSLTTLQVGATIAAATAVYGATKSLFGLGCLPILKKNYRQSKASREYLFDCEGAAHMINDGHEQEQYKKMAKELGVADDDIRTLYTRQVAPIFSDSASINDREFKGWKPIKDLPNGATACFFALIKPGWKQIEPSADTLSFVPGIVGKEKEIVDMDRFIAFADGVQDPLREFEHYNCTVWYMVKLPPTSEKSYNGFRTSHYFEETTNDARNNRVYFLEGKDENMYTATRLMEKVRANLFSRDGSTIPEKEVWGKSLEGAIKYRVYDLHPRHRVNSYSNCGSCEKKPWMIRFTYASDEDYSEYDYAKFVWQDIGEDEYLKDTQQYVYKVREYMINNTYQWEEDPRETYDSNEKRYWRAEKIA